MMEWWECVADEDDPDALGSGGAQSTPGLLPEGERIDVGPEPADAMRLFIVWLDAPDSE